MIAYTYINYNLAQLHSRYEQTDSGKVQLYYSKLALLELCGWIEESMDDVVLRAAKRSLKTKTAYKSVQEVVKINYGFDYEKHFCKMLAAVWGYRGIEKIESRIDDITLVRFKAALGNLKKSRNREAHTHIKGVMRIIDAPSVTISYFNDVHPGLYAFQTVLRDSKIF